MKYAGVVVALLLCMLIGYGCVEQEETMTIAKDGSGTVTVSVTAAEALLKGAPATKEDLQKKMNKEGVEVTEFSIEVIKEGKSTMKLGFKFKDINLLRTEQGFSDIEFAKDDKGNITFLQKLPVENVEDPKAAEMLKGLKLKYVITFPNAITETNADKKDGATATWEYDIAKLQSMAKDKKPFELKAVFSGEGVTFKLEKPEAKPKEEAPKEEPKKEGAPK